MSRMILLIAGYGLCVSVASGAAPAAPKTEHSGKGIETSEQLFQQWLTHRPDAEAFAVECVTREFDHAFGVERLSSASMQWHSPERWDVRSVPVRITDAMKTAREKPGARVRRNSDGTAYQLESADAETCSRRSDEYVYTRDGERCVLNISLPTTDVSFFEELLISIIRSPDPRFLFFQPSEVQKCCVVSSLRPVAASDGADAIRLTVRSRSPTENRWWKEAEVILDTRTWTPRHVKVMNLSDTIEQVYSFQKYKPLAGSEVESGDTTTALEASSDVAK